MSSLDAAFSGSSAAKVEELFVTVPPESLKSRRKSVTTTGVTSTPVDPFAQTTSVVEQSNAAIEQAREMMRTAEEVPDSATGDEDAEKTEEGEDLDLRESVDLDDCNTATL
ncbi:unnamed protein product [Symbiodinium microadriaticum]|nr:unnamed protein product [Symbiodinium microadriaticum]